MKIVIPTLEIHYDFDYPIEIARITYTSEIALYSSMWLLYTLYGDGAISEM